MTDLDLTLIRLYLDPDEVAQFPNPQAGYPLAWIRSRAPLVPRIPDYVREQAGHRCVRCGHPFIVGETPGHWSPCDDLCTHGGPTRWVDGVYPRGGLPHGEVPDPTLEAEWRILTVHHLNGVKHDCRWWNLASLCQRCHLTIQSKVILDRPYTREHTQWFKPYAAGFYASEYMGEELTREETLSRLDEILAPHVTAQALWDLL